MKKVLVVVGPTAVGKSDFAVKCAKKFNGSIISGDSIQVYKGLNIGSGKVTLEEMDGIKHECIDILEPTNNYSVYDFQQIARSKIDEITNNKELPIICGGTGLYIKACLYDYVFDNEEKKDTSKYDNYTNEQLYELLKEKDLEASLNIHMNNRKRVIRALVIAESGQKKSDNINNQKHEMLYDALIVGLTCDREKLYARINHRVEKMVENGLVDEVKGLLDKGITFEYQCMQGIGYREFREYFNGEKSLDETISDIQKHSRQFAKRQYTWFNNQTDCHWFSINDELDKAMELIEEWLAN